MFKKKIYHFAWKHTSDLEHTVFDESFWHWYVDSYSRLKSNDLSDPIPPNPKNYNSNSSAVVTLLKYFEQLNLPIPSTNQIIALLKSPFSQGDIVKTFHLIRFYQLSSEGLFLTNESRDRLGGVINYVGAENWENVMCYLDALLFSMFANLESFEPILFISNQHNNRLVNQLSAILRLYVSLLRSGNLITTDLTTRLCELLMKLGFNEALSHRQQDSASLFEFLTETLSMPFLTFKIDIKHGGKFKKEDDQKYSKERILFVSIPDEEENTQQVEKSSGQHFENLALNSDNGVEDGILLEECLEHYFNNSISVKRELERRATLESSRGSNPGGEVSYFESDTDILSAASNNHNHKHEPIVGAAESYEEVSSSNTSLLHANSARRLRSDSKNQTRYSSRTRSSTLSIWSLNEENASKLREVSLPAWMFLRLLPFYTDDNEVSDADNESIVRNSKEFVNRRPILPICLKRYSYNTTNSQARRSLKRIIIPPIINLPQFVADDANDDATGNYKLILESAVCHRGNSISSGHFISVVRKDTNNIEETDEAYSATWYLYDDMKKKSRVVEKSFKDIFNTEWPYILFYRLVSNDETNNGNHSGNVSSNSSTDNCKVLSAPSITKPVIIPQGSKNKYWAEDTLTPIISASNSPSIRSEDGMSLKKLESAISSTSSIPIPDISPVDSKFVDIRNKYFWYVTDKDKNYYKELPCASKDGNRDQFVNINPQFRRNNQWSDKSSISSIKNTLLEIKQYDQKPDLNEVDEKLDRLTIISRHSSATSNSIWKRSKKIEKNNSDNTTLVDSQANTGLKHTYSSFNVDDTSKGGSPKPFEYLHENTTNVADSIKVRSKLHKKIKKRRDEYRKEKCMLM